MDAAQALQKPTARRSSQGSSSKSVLPVQTIEYLEGNGGEMVMQIRSNRTDLQPLSSVTHGISFFTFDGDASAMDIEEAEFPHNRWYPLQFYHDVGLSRIDISGDQPLLASPGGGWINQLGLGSYNYQESDSQVQSSVPPPSEGLAGNLAILIALIAFSCGSRDLDNILLNDRAWRRYQWRGHNRQNGRRGERGKVVTIYLDPENPEGSTPTNIYMLEWTGGSMLQ